MKQILVAVDEHPHADKVVENGMQLAKAVGAGIVLTYVVPDTEVPAKFRDEHGDALPEHYKKDQFLRLVGQLAEKVEKAGIRCECAYPTGNPEIEILKTAKRTSASYIVLGIRGHKGLGRLKAIGDVARDVIERSTVPVIAVP